jgi:putative ABC transport system substrate-binding protein
MNICLRRREFIAALGGAAAWPLAASTQQAAMPVIGYLTAGMEDPSLTTQFNRDLAEQGYVDGRNAEILYRPAQTGGDRPAMAADLVRRRVTVLVGTTAGCAVAAKSATATIPIVFVTGADPVELGLVESFRRPGSNVTGTTFLTRELTAKWLELLREIVPGASPIESADIAARQVRADTTCKPRRRSTSRCPQRSRRGRIW